jgi:hypothetical protein
MRAKRHTRGKKLNATRKKQKGGAMPDIYIVYFAYLDVGNQNWDNSRAKTLILEQLKELNDMGLADAAKKIDIVITAPKNSNFNNSSILKLDKATRNIKALSETIKKKIVIHGERGNSFEYAGLRRVWDIAKLIHEDDPSRSDNSIILYFHSKGMSNGNKNNVKTPENKMLTDMVIKPWKEIAERFASEPKLNKAGHSGANDGWIWFNFWWVRASYVYGPKMRSPRPILTERRHYYEDWLGRRVPTDDKSDTDNSKKDKEREVGTMSGVYDSLSLCQEGPSTKLGLGLHPAFDKCPVEKPEYKIASGP